MPVHIFGPCSAETREQVLLTARQLKEACGELPFIFRAGAWKPRTSPSSFQGAGEKALEWLQEVQQMGIPVATEVATPEHVEAALKAQIDYLWIGARTSANPIAVQAIADVLAGGRIKGVLIKNPVNADAALWLGNIERLEKTGVPVMAIHRGCAHKPCWAMAHEVRTARPDIPLLIDPSHMSGDATQIPALLSKAAELNYDGTIIEVHCCPEEALSDNRQQLTPGECRRLIEVSSESHRALNTSDTELNWLRAEMDEVDDRLWETIAERMAVSRRIGEYKQTKALAALQPERYRQIVASRLEWAEQQGIPAVFVQQLMDIIHNESVRIQKKK